MTEDDTFRVLTQIPAHEMKAKLFALMTDSNYAISTNNAELVRALMKQNGWRIEDLITVLK